MSKYWTSAIFRALNWARTPLFLSCELLGYWLLLANGQVGLVPVGGICLSAGLYLVVATLPEKFFRERALLTQTPMRELLDEHVPVFGDSANDAESAPPFSDYYSVPAE